MERSAADQWLLNASDVALRLRGCRYVNAEAQSMIERPRARARMLVRQPSRHNPHEHVTTTSPNLRVWRLPAVWGLAIGGARDERADSSKICCRSWQSLVIAGGIRSGGRRTVGLACLDAVGLGGQLSAGGKERADRRLELVRLVDVLA